MPYSRAAGGIYRGLFERQVMEVTSVSAAE
jgi:hypothetical protein